MFLSEPFDPRHSPSAFVPCFLDARRAGPDNPPFADSIAFMRVHLLVPGLFSRLPEWRHSYAWLPQAAGLQGLLSAAPTQGEEAGEPLAVAAGLLGVSGSAVALRRRAQGIAHDSPGWLCADPVHLRADVDTAILVEAEHLTLTPDEARALVGELATMFAADGWRFEVADATQWYAHPPDRFSVPELPSVAELAGKDVGTLFRQIPQSVEWKRFYAELQMTLTQSGINRRREARGASPINALWFWGGGALGSAGVPRVQAAQGRASVLGGMARAAGLTLSPPDLTEALAGSRDVLVLLDELRAAAAYDDIEAWQEAFAHLDAEWFAPLAQALDSRRLDEVMLHADQRCWRVRRRRGLARWRRAAPLAQTLGLEALR